MEDQEYLIEKRKKESVCDAKLVSFVLIGGITFIYVFAELGAAIYLNSLVLLSDGFHNLSDVVSLTIAFWARKASKRQSSDNMSYGWARTELLGGLTNGCFLLALVLYVILESIPKFIYPVPIESGLLFIIISGSGLAINTIGTIVFSLTGMEHGHSHSHGGGHGHSHGHSHGDKKKKKDKKEQLELSTPMEVRIVRANEEEKKKKEKKEGHKHSHGHGHDHGHDDHDHGNEQDHGHEHNHSEEEKKAKKEKKEKHGHSHGHSHGEEGKEKKEKHGHSHGHGHGEGKEKKEKHGHSHEHKEKPKKKRDENTHAIFLHFLGDAISSLMVLGAGLLLHFFHGARHKWTDYIDPVTSLIISALILYTTIPLVKRCSMILLQGAGDVKIAAIKSKLLGIEGLLSLHDLHVWQLVDGMSVASIHVAVEEGVDFNLVVSEIKRTFHKYGVHSTTIQPEFVPRNHSTTPYCVQNCVKECEEDWCCKKTAENTKQLAKEFSINTAV